MLMTGAPLASPRANMGLRLAQCPRSPSTFSLAKTTRLAGGFYAWPRVECDGPPPIRGLDPGLAMLSIGGTLSANLACFVKPPFTTAIRFNNPLSATVVHFDNTLSPTVVCLNNPLSTIVVNFDNPLSATVVRFDNPLLIRGRPRSLEIRGGATGPTGLSSKVNGTTGLSSKVNGTIRLFSKVNGTT